MYALDSVTPDFFSSFSAVTAFGEEVREEAKAYLLVLNALPSF